MKDHFSLLPQVREPLPPIDYEQLFITSAITDDSGRPISRGPMLKRILITHYNKQILPLVTSCHKDYAARKMSIQRLADLMGKTRPWTSNLLNGKRILHDKDAMLLTRITCEWLVSTPASWLAFEALFPYCFQMKVSMETQCPHILLTATAEKEEPTHSPSASTESKGADPLSAKEANSTSTSSSSLSPEDDPAPTTSKPTQRPDPTSLPPVGMDAGTRPGGLFHKTQAAPAQNPTSNPTNEDQDQ